MECTCHDIQHATVRNSYQRACQSHHLLHFQVFILSYVPSIIAPFIYIYDGCSIKNDYYFFTFIVFPAKFFPVNIS